MAQKRNPLFAAMSASLRAQMHKASASRRDEQSPRGEMLVFSLATDAGDEMFVYGDIGDDFWSDEPLTANRIAQELAQLNGKDLLIRINSYGGAVNDGVAIFNAIRLHKKRTGATITARIDGIAASIASLISQAADKVVMPANTTMMIHAPWTMAAGNASEFEDVIAVLRHYEDTTATSYASHSGMSEADFKAQFYDGADYYMTAAQALAFGFADEVEAEAGDDASDADETVDAALAAAIQRIGAKASALAAGLPRFNTAAAAAFAHGMKPGAVHASASRTPKQPAAAQPAQAVQPTPANAGYSQPAPSGAATGAPSMTPEEIQAAAKKAADGALAALRTRNNEITALAEPHFRNQDVKSLHDRIISEADPDITAAHVGKQILALLAKPTEPLNAGAAVIAGADSRDKTREAMSQSIRARAGIEKADRENPYRGFTMAEMARDCVARAGVSMAGMDRMQIVGLAFTHSSSDFPGILGDTAAASVLRGYQMVEANIEQISRAVSVPDFKPTTLLGLGVFSELLEVKEGAEFKYGTFSELSQSIKLATYGRLFSITRQAIINDQLGLFDDVAVKMGQSAKRTIASALFNLLTSNPPLADGKALFHVDHNNLVNPGTVISTTSVDGMRVKMAMQTGPDGENINVPLKTLVTPIALGGLARQVRESQYEVNTNKNNTTPNIVRGTFDVLDDPRLDANSTAAWYGVADTAYVDSLVIGYLDGNQEPFLDQHEGFTVDGIAWKVRLDAAAAVADYRGLVKNPGA